MRDFSDFDRTSRRVNRVFGAIFATMAALILCIWVTVGMLAYQAVQAGPEGLGRMAGAVLKGARDAYHGQ